MERQQIEDLIRQIGSDPRPLGPRAGTHWALLFEYPPKNRTLITAFAPLEPKATLQMSISRGIGPRQRAAFDALSNDAKLAFFAELQQVLRAGGTQFTVQPGPTSAACARAAAVFNMHSDDSLTLETFSRSAGQLIEADMRIDACITRALGREQPERPATTQ